jgi:hypothetical protein
LTGVTGRGTQSLSFTGSEADLNAALATLAYTPNTGFINASTAGTQITGAPLETLTATATGTSAGGIGMGTNTATTSVLVRALNNSPRIITPLANQTYLADTTSVLTESAINFTIADGDTLASAFVNNAATGARITATSDNPNLILPADIGVSIGGTGSARTITMKHQANITGVANVTITINDGTNQNTYTFKVTVLPAPSYYWSTLTTSAHGAQITYDSNGDLYALNWTAGTVWKITPQGTATLLKSGFTNPLGLAIDANKTLYVSDGDGSIKKLLYNSSTNSYGTATVLAAGVSAGEILISPDGTTLYGGKFYQIVRIDTTSGAVSVLAGSGTTGSGRRGALQVA